MIRKIKFRIRSFKDIIRVNVMVWERAREIQQARNDDREDSWCECCGEYGCVRRGSEYEEDFGFSDNEWDLIDLSLRSKYADWILEGNALQPPDPWAEQMNDPDFTSQFYKFKGRFAHERCAMRRHESEPWMEWLNPIDPFPERTKKLVDGLFI